MGTLVELWKTEPELRFLSKLVVGLLALCVCFDLCAAKKESDTYNRLTGAHTTMWDAMWVELRVQDGVERK